MSFSISPVSYRPPLASNSQHGAQGPTPANDNGHGFPLSSQQDAEIAEALNQQLEGMAPDMLSKYKAALEPGELTEEEQAELDEEEAEENA